MPDKTAGPVIVALSNDSAGPDLIRAAAALARESGAAMECVTIDTGKSASQEDGERMAETLRLARSAGATVTSAPDIDAAAGLLKYASVRSASAIVLGQGRPKFFRRRVADRLISARPDFAVVAIGSPLAARTSARPRPAREFGENAGHYAAALVIVAAVTGLNLALASYAGYWSAAITYLAAISLMALALDRWPVFAAALLSAIAWDFLFIPPRFTMFISRTEDVLMLALYLVVALSAGWLTARLRSNERLLAAREGRLTRLNALASALAGAGTLGVILDKSVSAIAEAFSVEVVVILRDGQGGLKNEAESGWEPLDANAREAARSAFEGMKIAGRFTKVMPKSEWHFVPMEGPSGCLGVLGLRAAHDAAWSEEIESFLRTMAYTVSSAVAREIPAVN